MSEGGKGKRQVAEFRLLGKRLLVVYGPSSAPYLVRDRKSRT